MPLRLLPTARRPPNGVIITTKKAGKNQLKVDFDAQLTAQFCHTGIHMLDAQQWGDVYWKAYQNDGIQPRHDLYGSGPTPVIPEYIDSKKTIRSGNTNWADEVYKKALLKNYNVTVSRGGENGWTHLFSIPRVWTLKAGKICQQPHPALQSLRQEQKVFPFTTIKDGQPLLVSKGSHQVEIEVTIDPKECKRFGFIMGKHPEQKEFTKVFYDFEQKQFVVDKTHSSLRKSIPANGRSGSYSLARKQKVNVHIFIDGSVVEVFVNKRCFCHQNIFLI